MSFSDQNPEIRREMKTCTNDMHGGFQLWGGGNGSCVVNINVNKPKSSSLTFGFIDVVFKGTFPHKID